jgi:hypothetical protein
MKTLRNLIALITLAVSSAHADGITITLDTPNQDGDPGQTLQFFGVIANTGTDLAPVYLNLDSFNFGLSDASYTLTDNFANTPLSLDASTSSDDIDLFDITLSNPVADPAGLYSGTYALIGGEDGGDLSGTDNLAQASFSVDIESAPSGTPEPGTWYLLAGGLALLGRRFGRRPSNR